MTGYGSIGAAADSNNDKHVDLSKGKGGSPEESTPLVKTNTTAAEVEYAKFEKSLSWWSRLTFGWFAPLLDRGNTNGKLDREDLDIVPFPPDYETEKITAEFYKYWDEELRMAAEDIKDEKTSSKKLWFFDSRRWFKAPSLWRTLSRAFGWEFFKAGLLKLGHDLCIFVGPQVLNGLIYFLRDPNAPMSNGIMLTLAVTISQLAMSFCLRHYFFKCYITGLQIRTSVVMAVYKKALVLSSGERQIRSTGEITNLMSIDAQRMQQLTSYLHAIWYSAVQIGLALYFLFQQLGVSCLGGALVIVVMIPVTKLITQWMGSMQKKLMKARDERVELNSEVLSSMKVVKLQAWEESFQDRILSLRKAELRKLKEYFIGNSFAVMLWSGTPLAVALATFTAYTLSGNELEVASALTALTLFDILRFPLFMLPNVVNNIVEASVSINRFRSFLLCEDYKVITTGDLLGNGIRMQDATFAYESRKPKMASDSSPAEVELSNTKWELSLIKSQLEDAENCIKELTGGKKEEGGGGKNDQEQEDVLVEVESKRETNLLCLKRINLNCEGAELVAVVGGVGCGKSSLLNAMLGEVRALSGTTNIKGSISYFSQSPFILNATLKDNILFSHVNEPFDKEKYDRAIECCALKHDLELLPAGDMTEIGEKGITLSGGQKARVAMARAVYHDADICLLDDPLAAVDAHVGAHIFKKCIIDELLLSKGSTRSGSASDGQPRKKRTVILVTNALQYLSNPLVDRIVLIKDGRKVEEGSYGELSSADTIFARYLAVLKETGDVSVSDDNSTSTPGLSISSEGSTSATSLTELGDNVEEPEVASALSPKRKSQSKRISLSKPASPVKEDDKLLDSGRLATDELQEREVGHIQMDVYLSYAKSAGGLWIPIAILLGYGGVEAINVLSRWWLTYWSGHGNDGNQRKYLAIYAIINVAALLASFGRILLVMLCGLRASRVLFAKLLDSILQAPMSFFDTTPIGRIVNRFSKDIYTIDESLVSTIRSYLSTLFQVLSTIIVISGITPVFTLCLIPIIGFYIMQQMHFTTTYRELKRLDSVNRSPLFALLGETLDGVSTVRAFAAQSALSDRLSTNLNVQQHAYFLVCTAQCWLAVRLELVGTLIVTFACLSSVLQHGTKGGDETFAGLAGLAISYSLSVTQSLNWSVRMGSDFEADMVSVERVNQYTKIPGEAARHTDADKLVDSGWPTGGEIDMANVKLRYRPNLPLVLKGLNLHIPARSKIGVVGRTGAGKSTIMVALFRIVELDSGCIKIDGIDHSTIGLSKLRSKVAVIPQDPVLFSGSIRTNLDPFDESSDERLYEVLQRVGMYESTSSKNTNSTIQDKKSGSSTSLTSLANQVQSLSDQVNEGGSNFSVGQRQLLVIARALLCGANIVIMDEATAAVDADTDARIQRVMRTEFKDATCITVAHRLNTIMDSDYILVMDDGRVAEFDPPRTLLERGGMFSDLVDAAAKEQQH